jgi:molybdate transport system substrate-binding protein
MGPVTRKPLVGRLAVFVSALLLLALGSGPTADASEVQVAVAANFARPMERLAADFEHDTGHHAVVSTGATGALFAQIEKGAPFEVFLSADRATPEKLERDGFAVAGTRRTYAVGTLVLWSAKAGYVDAAGAVLKGGSFQHLAIANPKLAPYGTAAMETLAALGLTDALRSKIVQGESIAQTFQFVASGSAEVGFVSLSQVVSPGGAPAPAQGSYWVVPATLHAPIQQDAVVLRKGEDSAAAKALLAYLASPKAREVIRSFGYEPGAPPTPAPAKP